MNLDHVKWIKVLKYGKIAFLRNPKSILKNGRTIRFHFDMFHGNGVLDKALDLLNEEDKKDFTSENGDKFLETNEDKMSEYLGFEIDTFRMTDDYTMGEPMGVEFVHSDEDFEGWMDQVGSFWD